MNGCEFSAIFLTTWNHLPYRPLCLLQTFPSEVLPAAGIVLVETGDLKEVLCKPKLMPIKSSELVKVETMMARDEKAASTAAGAPAPR